MRMTVASTVGLLTSSFATGLSNSARVRSQSALLSRVSTTAVRAMMTSESEMKGPQFDAEKSRIYAVIAENHRHPSGPWVTMLEKIHAYADALPRRRDSKLQVLDLATGPGEPAETIARQFPEASVVATDVSPDMLAIAREKTATLPHMTTQLANMEHLEQFEDNTFDIVTCCYGFMFPQDKDQALRESYRVLKPGGKLVATTWNRVRIMEKVRAIMEQVLETPPPPPPINPLSLAEPGLFESMVTRAGYSATNLDITTHVYPFDLTDDPEMQFQATILPVQDTLQELPDGMEKARRVYETIQLDYGVYNDHGHYIVPGNEYKLTVATK